MAKLFVGNLSWNTTDDTLRAKFSEFGNLVSANVVMDRYTGKSRGFGFVEYASDEEAKKAMEATNGTDLDGRAISVSEARPQEDRGNRTGGFQRRDDNRGGFRRDDRRRDDR